MPENKYLRFFLGLIYALLACLTLWLSAAVLLPVAAPFLLAALLAAALERPIVFLHRRLHLPRGWAAALGAALLWAAILSIGGYLFWRIWCEGIKLVNNFPALLSALSSTGGAFERWSYRVIMAAPVELQSTVAQMLAGALGQLSVLLQGLYGNLLVWAAQAAAAAPGALLFLVTSVLATFFLSAGRPRLAAFFEAVLSPRWRRAALVGRRQLGRTLGGWLRAQGILMCVTLLILVVGLLLLGVEAAVSLAVLIAMLDALPVFGTGTALFPWALISALEGDRRRAAGLLVLYGVIWLTRSLLEPKLAGERMGISPLASLVAMYAGFHFFGVPGMIVAPPCVALALQIWLGIRAEEARAGREEGA